MTYDQSHDGADNGSGGRFMDSIEQIRAGQTRQTEAVAKAANPADLTYEDLVALPAAMASELMSSGQVAHLGYGRRRSGPRPRMGRG